MLTPQEIENVILVVVGLLALWQFQRLVKHVHVISACLRLAQTRTVGPASAPSLPVTNKELEAIIDKTEAGRYARFSFPDSLRPFKE